MRFLQKKVVSLLHKLLQYMRKTIIILVLLLLSLMAEAQGMQIYADAWAEAEKVQNMGIMTGICDALRLNNKEKMINDNTVYDLQGRRVQSPKRGLYIKDGKNIMIK
jgi:hypothetical protein